MKLKVYDGEYFERSRWRYLAFGLCILGIVILSVWYENILGAVIMLMTVGAYLFFQQKTAHIIELELKDTALLAGTKLLPFTAFQGFVVEMDKNTGLLHNLVLIRKSSTEIYTFKDEQEDIQRFCEVLAGVLPQLEKYHQSFADKLLRKCKL